MNEAAIVSLKKLTEKFRTEKFSSRKFLWQFALFCLSLHAHGELTANRLRCEYLENPLGIDAAKPRLSWIVDSRERAQVQTAYQILVASSDAKLKEDKGDLWDSGKVASDRTLYVPYGGKALGSTQRCVWKVRVWDRDGKVSTYSTPAFWEMGLLNPQDWRGKWIGRTADTNSSPAPLLRRTFGVDDEIKRARVYICGLGYYELHINGHKIGDHLLDPGYTRYDKRDLYVTYDVTRDLRQGTNAIGVILGNGWYNVHTRAAWSFDKAPWRAAPKLLMQLQVEYADGRMETLATDRSWKASTGPIVFDSIYGGETYDARLERPGWDTTDYDDSGWANALVVAAPGGRLTAQMMPAIKVDRELIPSRITEPKQGIFVVDMGQNFAGFAELRVRGPPGTKVVMRYGERLSKGGMLDTADIEQHVKRADPRQQFQTDTYILNGKGMERWHSRFTYHGFQYVEVTGFPGKLSKDNLRGVFIHSAVPAVGEFECSNPLLNKIWQAARWSYLSNLQGIPTDCPHREKNGWTGDAHLAAEQGLLNFDAAAVYTKWINDIADEQRPNGMLPGIVPTSGWGYDWGNGPAWDSAFLLIPYYLYEYCGDEQILTNHYEGMARYVDYLTSKAKDGIVSIGLNDWAPYKTQTPADITSTAYYYRDTCIASLAAHLAGRNDVANKYADLAQMIGKNFDRKFFPEIGLGGSGSQTAFSCALYQLLLSPGWDEGRVLTNLLASIERNNWHIDTGILGAKYVLRALTQNGRADVAYRIASQRDYPSWGWWIEQGATTLWEQWNGSESRNHIMFGDISAWFHEGLAGIYRYPWCSVYRSFKRFEIKPNPVGDLTAARAKYESVRGTIVSDWKIEQGRFYLKATIPANTSASGWLPTSDVKSVQESGNPAANAPGVVHLSQVGERTYFEIGSGTYFFTCDLKR
ncbi:MAG: alpha-rhamnosidase [Verrucomicrobia bacterium]|nr:MAG: alpha-rhamnosidase [Verrucomicrobiota bacterium]